MAHESAEEFRDAVFKFLALRLQLGDCFVDAVGRGNLFAAQVLYQLDVVVAGNGNRAAAVNHIHDQTQHVRAARTSVAEVAEEGSLASLGVDERPVFVADVAQSEKQLFQLVAAAVNVPDDVEGSVLVLFVVPHLCADNLGVFELFGAADHVDKAEALFFQAVDALAHSGIMAVKHPFGKRSVGAFPAALQNERFRHVYDDRRGVNVHALRKFDDLFAGSPLNVGRVHDGQLKVGQPLFGGVVQQVERVGGCFLAVFVVADHSPEEVGGQHLRRSEVCARKGGFARGRSAYQRDQAALGQFYSEGFCRITHFS